MKSITVLLMDRSEVAFHAIKDLLEGYGFRTTLITNHSLESYLKKIKKNNLRSFDLGIFNHADDTVFHNGKTYFELLDELCIWTVDAEAHLGERALLNYEGYQQIMQNYLILQESLKSYTPPTSIYWLDKKR